MNSSVKFQIPTFYDVQLIDLVFKWFVFDGDVDKETLYGLW